MPATNKYILLVNRLFATTGGTLKRVFLCEAMMPDSFCADPRLDKCVLQGTTKISRSYSENMLKAFLNSWNFLRICQSVFCLLIFPTIIEMLLAKLFFHPLSLCLSLSSTIFANFSQFILYWKGLFMWIPIGSLVNCAILKRKLLILIIFEQFMRISCDLCVIHKPLQFFVLATIIIIIHDKNNILLLLYLLFFLLACN